MVELTSIPDKQAPVFARPRLGARPSVYWKCQIGRRIHLAREEAAGRTDAGMARLTREELARRLAIAPRRLWEIENGLVGVDGAEIARIAEALQVHPGYFFEDGAKAEQPSTTSQRLSDTILCRTINELESDERALLERLVIYFSSVKYRRVL